MNKEIAKVLSNVREKTPLIQCITNYVTVNDCANILLSFGASPAMVEAREEAYDFAKISSAVYLNVGTLTEEQADAMVEASRGAKEANVPVILDPVACGAIKRKITVINKVLEAGKVDVIKGNIGEIKFLAGLAVEARGVDSIDDGQGIESAAKALAKKFNCVVAATGEVDIVTDGERVAKIHNGSKLLTMVTGAGCMVGALTSATAAVSEDKLYAAVASIVSMNIAAEKAEKEAKLPGSFRVKLIDYINAITEEDIIKEGKIEWI
ncbi:MAG: hydroxyethylthiazole kinase [Clostridiaceae bacterium]